MVRSSASQRRDGSWRILLNGLLSTLLLLQWAHTARAAVMAVDLGSEFLKISIVKPGRTPISIVLNEMSKRKTSAAVAFVNGERLLGEDAAVLQPRFPERVFTQLRDVLGVRATDAAVTEVVSQQHLPWNVVDAPGRGTVAFQPAKDELYSAEETVAGLLHYAKGLATAAADGAPVVDCVITVPPWFAQSHRQALLDAADAAGLNVLSLINSHAAAALQFGIERNFANKTEFVVLYDMGASSTEAALVKYSSFDIKEAGRVNTYGQFEVVDVAWLKRFGSSALDALVLKHFAAEFDEKYLQGKGSILDHPKAVAKLRKQVKRVKHVLSANTEAPLSVEELYDGIDFRASISREQFEALAGDFFQKAAEPLMTLLQRNQEAAKSLSAVELLGGGSRVPKLQAALSDALGGRTLDRHLDADEAVVLGAALFAANLSTTFRLRKFGMNDGITHPVAFKLEQTPGAADNEEGTNFLPKLLLPFLKRLPVKRVTHLHNITSDPVKLHLLQGPPVPGTTADQATEPLATLVLTGVDEAKKKYDDSGYISAHFKADSSGIISFDKAEVVLERTELVNVTVPLNVTANATDNAAANATGAAGSAEGSNATDAGQAGNGTTGNGTDARPATTVMQRERRKAIRLPLEVGGPGWVLPGLSENQRKALKARMAAVQAADDAKRATANAKNDLESYILSTRSSINEDETVAAVTTEKQRTSFLQQLNAAEDWLYEDGEDADAPKHKAKLAQLRAVGDPIALRCAEVGKRAALTAKVDKFVAMAEDALISWPKSKPWINETQRTDFAKEVKDFQSWFEGQQAAQAKKKAHEEPAYRSDDASAKLDAVRKSFAKLKNSKKPKPPPAPPSAKANGTAEGNATADAEATAKPEGADGKKGAGGKAGDQKAWDDLLKDMDPKGRKRMEELLKNSATFTGGKDGKPKFMNLNINDLLKKQPGGDKRGDQDGFADGLDEESGHEEL